MQVEGLDLAPREVSVLQARTGGWPAGVRFAAMSLATRTDTREAIREIRGDTGNVAEYLMSEVLAKQSPGAREFLLRTCVADELVPDLVGSLTGQPCDLHLLEVMARGNSFIELVPGRHDRYRYHALFREFLRGRLAFESPGLVGELHRVAAAWLVADGQVFAAIRHAARAQEWQMATELLVDRPRLRRAADGVEGDAVAGPVHRPAGRRTRHARGRHPGGAVAVRAGPAPQRAAPGRRAEAAGGGSFAQSQVRGLAIAVLHAVTASLGADTDAGLRAALVAERAIRLAPTRDLDALVELRRDRVGLQGSGPVRARGPCGGLPGVGRRGADRPRRPTSRGRTRS
jgi:LuxR family maltose regulon positive regulatory protein